MVQLGEYGEYTENLIRVAHACMAVVEHKSLASRIVIGLDKMMGKNNQIWLHKHYSITSKAVHVLLCT